MQPPDQETGLILKYGGAILGAAASAIATIGGWLFHRVIEKHDEEIRSIKKGISDMDAKLDGKVDSAVWEQNRREARDNIITLHEKIEKIGSDGEARHRELMNILLTQRNAHRAGD